MLPRIIDPLPGHIFWLTGLSGAGKSTNANFLAAHLRSLGHACVLLDGDDLRAVVDASSCYSRVERVRLGIQYARLCSLLAAQGIDVIIATIALYSEIHAWKEQHLPNCCTIFLDVPIAELRRRDPKRIYERFFNKQLTNVAGLDLEVDMPVAPTIHVRWRPGMDVDATWQAICGGVSAFLHPGENAQPKGRP